MTSLRKIEANRHNAQKSTGPKTEAGKAVSRANALKHGLAGEGDVSSEQDAAAVQERLDAWRPSYNPATPEQEWLFRQIVVNSVRVDRCQADERAARAYAARRASLCWDDDRALAAEKLGKRLAKDPARVVLKLRKTLQGCD